MSTVGLMHGERASARPPRSAKRSEPAPMSALVFRLMAWEFRLMARRFPPEQLLVEARVRPGERIVDYGCGPGRYTIPAARRTGAIVYALDVHPLAFGYVRSAAAREGLANVITIGAHDSRAIESGSIDVVLLYDTLHDIASPMAALAEIRRMLRPGGRLSFTDHHLDEREVIELMEEHGLRFERRGARTLTFVRAVPEWRADFG